MEQKQWKLLKLVIIKLLFNLIKTDLKWLCWRFKHKNVWQKSKLLVWFEGPPKVGFPSAGFIYCIQFYWNPLFGRKLIDFRKKERGENNTIDSGHKYVGSVLMWLVAAKGAVCCASKQ